MTDVVTSVEPDLGGDRDRIAIVRGVEDFNSLLENLASDPNESKITKLAVCQTGTNRSNRLMQAMVEKKMNVAKKDNATSFDQGMSVSQFNPVGFDKDLNLKLEKVDKPVDVLIVFSTEDNQLKRTQGIVDAQVKAFGEYDKSNLQIYHVVVKDSEAVDVISKWQKKK